MNIQYQFGKVYVSDTAAWAVFSWTNVIFAIIDASTPAAANKSVNSLISHR